MPEPLIVFLVFIAWLFICGMLITIVASIDSAADRIVKQLKKLRANKTEGI